MRLTRTKNGAGMYEWMAKSKAKAAIVFSPPLKLDAAFADTRVIARPLEKRTPVRDIQAVGTAAGAIWNPIAAARRLSDAMLRWRCISS